ncbi:serine protease, partial [Streptomyces durbertensis]
MAVPAEPVLFQLCDLAGRARGTGFLADDLGTLVTTHEAVDGLSRLVLRAPGGAGEIAETAAITPLPGRDLALVATSGLGAGPLVVATERPPGSTVLVWFDRWLPANVTGLADVTYTATDRFHTIEGALELDLPPQVTDQLRLNPRATGAPVLDAATGAVVGVLAGAVHTPYRASGFALPLRPSAGSPPDPQHAPLARLLARNDATVPGWGRDLNLAGALHLTGATVATATAALTAPGRRRPRPDVERELHDFGESDASVLALVGDPGTGRSTELAAWAARRAGGSTPRPTIWLRGADLRADDSGVRAALARSLAEAGRVAGSL